MAAPHNPAWVEEPWDPTRLAVLGAELVALRDAFAVSGGWAWHFPTSTGRHWLKYAHDHRDADPLVAPDRATDPLVR